MNISNNAHLVVRKSAGYYVSSLLKDKYSQFMADSLMAFVKALEIRLPKLADKRGQYSSRFSKKFKIPGSDLCLKIQAIISIREQFSRELELKVQRIEVSIPELHGVDAFNLTNAINETMSFVFEKEVLGV